MKAGFSSRLILLAGLCVGLAGPVSAIDLGKLIDLGGKLVEINSDVSEDEEVRIGGNLVSGLLGAAPLVDDEGLQRYVNDVGFWVASRSARPEAAR